jgi:hypothetical protein
LRPAHALAFLLNVSTSISGRPVDITVVPLDLVASRLSSSIVTPSCNPLRLTPHQNGTPSNLRHLLHPFKAYDHLHALCPTTNPDPAHPPSWIALTDVPIHSQQPPTVAIV